MKDTSESRQNNTERLTKTVKHHAETADLKFRFTVSIKLSSGGLLIKENRSVRVNDY